MPGHANFVGGPAARIRKLSSSSSSSHPNRRNTHLGGPSRIFKPRRENVQFDFPWVPAPYSESRHEEEMEEEQGGEGWAVEERERGGEGESSRVGGGQGGMKRKSVVLDMLENDLTLGGFEAGKQALLDLDDWAGLNDSYISFLPPSPPRSRHQRRAPSTHGEEHRTTRNRRQKKVVSDGEEEWEDGRELRRGDAYMHDEDDTPASPDEYTFDEPQPSSFNQLEHDRDQEEPSDFDPQPSPPPAPPQAQHQHQHQQQHEHQNQNQEHRPRQTHRSSVVHLPLSFTADSDGVARPHPANYPVPSSSSDGDAIVNATVIGTNVFEGEPIVEEENEEDLQVFAEGENKGDEHRTNSRNDVTEKPTTTKKKKKKRSSPDSQRITLGSPTIFHNNKAVGSPPYVSPSPPAARTVVASQHLEQDEKRWRSSQRPTTSSSSKWDHIELANPMQHLASELKLPDISGDASPLRPSPLPSRSSSLGPERVTRDEEVRGSRDVVVVVKTEEYEYTSNFDSRRWETHDEPDEEQPSWNDSDSGRRDYEEESSSQEIDVQLQQQQHDENGGRWMKD